MGDLSSLLNEPAIRAAARNRFGILLTTMMLAVAGVCLYFFAFDGLIEPWLRSQFGNKTDSWLFLAVLPAFAIFLGPTLLAELYCRKFRIACPGCNKDLNRNTDEILTTRCCPACNKRIVEGGQTRTRSVYERRRRWQQIAFLEAWFWLWPAIGGVSLVVYMLFPAAFADCPQALFIPALIGVAGIGWTWMRTRNRRYLPALACSTIVLALGLGAFLSV